MKIKEILISVVKEWRIWGVVSTCILLGISISIGWTTRIAESIFTLGVTVSVIVLLFLNEG